MRKNVFFFVGLFFLAAAVAEENHQTLSFQDVMVDGQYHFSHEQVVTVEDDKVLDGLLGVPENFRRRIDESYGSF